MNKDSGGQTLYYAKKITLEGIGSNPAYKYYTAMQ